MKGNILSDEEIANIAYDYYSSNLNIADISQKYNLSRYKISQAIQEALSKHIVTISIRRGVKRNLALEEQFKELFGLKEAFILRKYETKIKDQRKLVYFAAQQLQNYFQRCQNIGLTWGTTLLDIINNFQNEKNHDLNFVQLLGSPVDTQHRKASLVHIAAKKFDGKYRILPAPLYVTNHNLVTELKNEPFYQLLDSDYRKLDLVFTGIGTMQSVDEDEFARKYYKKIVFNGIKSNQVAGFIFGRPYTIDGKVFDQVDKYITGIERDEITQIPIRVVIEKNRFKAKALLGALRTGYVTHLMTNEGIAQRIMQEIEEGM